MVGNAENAVWLGVLSPNLWGVSEIGFSTDGRCVAAVLGESGYVWDAETGGLLGSIDNRDKFRSIVGTHHEARFCTFSQNHETAVTERVTSREVAWFNVPCEVLEPSPVEGSWAGANGDEVLVFELEGTSEA